MKFSDSATNKQLEIGRDDDYDDRRRRDDRDDRAPGLKVARSSTETCQLLCYGSIIHCIK